MITRKMMVVWLVCFGVGMIGGMWPGMYAHYELGLHDSMCLTPEFCEWLYAVMF